MIIPKTHPYNNFYFNINWYKIKFKKILFFKHNYRGKWKINIINDILYKVHLSEPKSIFQCFLKERLKEEKENQQKDLGSIKKYKNEFNNLTESKVKIYNNVFEKKLHE